MYQMPQFQPQSDGEVEATGTQRREKKGLGEAGVTGTLWREKEGLGYSTGLKTITIIEWPPSER